MSRKWLAKMNSPNDCNNLISKKQGLMVDFYIYRMDYICDNLYSTVLMNLGFNNIIYFFFSTSFSTHLSCIRKGVIVNYEDTIKNYIML